MKKISRPVFFWALYDFGNSAYATSILSVLFSVYLAKQLVPAEGLALGSWTLPAESVWGYLISAVMAAVILIAPPLGAYADHYGRKGACLRIFTGLGAVMAILLFWARPGHLGFALAAVFIGTIAYELSVVFYNALLNDLARADVRGFVSGLGFALGYIGGGLCLALNIWMLKDPALFGLEGEATRAVRSCFVVVGIWWFLFAVPLLFTTKDAAGFPPNRGGNFASLLKESFGQLGKTLSWIRRNAEIKKFLLSFVFYMDGIQTVLLMSAIFGARALGMSSAKLGLCFLMIQFVAFFGALAMGRLADRWSHKKVVIVTLVVYTLVVFWGAAIQSEMEFWILGVVVGIVMGGSQSASRSLFANLIPSEKSAELFSFYSVVGRVAALMGPFFFAFVSQNFSLRAAVASLSVFFVVGIVLLSFVNESPVNREPRTANRDQ